MRLWEGRQILRQGQTGVSCLEKTTYDARFTAPTKVAWENKCSFSQLRQCNVACRLPPAHWAEFRRCVAWSWSTAAMRKTV